MEECPVMQLALGAISTVHMRMHAECKLQAKLLPYAPEVSRTLSTPTPRLGIKH